MRWLRPARRWVLDVAKAWVAVVAFMFLTGHVPEFALVTVAVTAAVTVWWLITEMAGSVETAVWPATSRSSFRGRGKDGRAGVLQRQLMELDDRRLRSGRGTAVAAALVAVIDDRVVAGHGVTRGAEPGRFAEIVGADLAAFVDAAAAGAPAVTSQNLPGLLARIEAL